MNHPAYRLDPETYPVIRQTPTRLGDVNGARHVSNVAIAGIYEDARFEILFELRAGNMFDGEALSVMAQVNMTFLKTVRYPSMLTVASGVGRVGRTSFALFQGLFLAGDCVGLCDAVFVDRGPAGPLVLSAASRGRLAPLRCRNLPD